MRSGLLPEGLRALARAAAPDDLWALEMLKLVSMTPTDRICAISAMSVLYRGALRSEVARLTATMPENEAAASPLRDLLVSLRPPHHPWARRRGRRTFDA